MSESSQEIPTKFFDFKSLKETLLRFSLTLLSLGASLILGVLSFGGTYLLWPALIPSLTFSILAVVYEFEIYGQNLERTFEKLFTTDYFEEQLAREMLHPLLKDKNNPITKQFWAYRQDLNKILSNRKAVRQFAPIFSKQLRAETPPDASEPQYVHALYAYLHMPKPNNQPSLHEQYKTRLEARRWPLFGLKVFSTITSLFMGLSTTYMLVDLFLTVPMLATIPLAIWPIIITPLAVISGIAYGLLTYNAVTNLMANDTLRVWGAKLWNNLKANPYSLKNMGMFVTATSLFVMAVTLTLCTAGTWWTIVQKTPPLFNWMRRLPAVVMGVINPIFLGLSSLVFNFENASETLSMLNAFKGINFRQYLYNIQSTLKHLWEKENPLQWINPFRLTLVFILQPLKHLLFIGHIFSVGATTDRVPGLSPNKSFWFGSTIELVEDFPYFYKHSHPEDFNAAVDEELGESQGHEHGENLPEKIIKHIAKPICLLSAAWHTGFSSLNKKEHKADFWASYAEHLKPFENDEAVEPEPDVNIPGAFANAFAKGRVRFPQHEHKRPSPTASQNSSPEAPAPSTPAAAA
jgi:hypothetical protein